MARLAKAGESLRLVDIRRKTASVARGTRAKDSAAAEGNAAATKPKGRAGADAATPLDEDEPETFIPVSRFALMAALTRDEVWPGVDANVVKKFFRYLAAWRHISYSERLVKLKEAYLPFSPDRDTVSSGRHSADQMAELQQRLVRLVGELLAQANYREITLDKLDEIFNLESHYGLDLSVDVGEFEELLIFSRGADTKVERKRTWKKFYFGHEETVIPIYQRLFLLLKLKPEEMRVKEIARQRQVNLAKARKILKRNRKMLPEGVTPDFVYLKLFKQIPRTDLQMMFPNTRVEFRLFDKIKLGVTAGGGTIASVVGTATKILAATNPLKLALALIGLLGVIFRQVMKFFSQRNEYMRVLAQNLYFHSLADNRGVLTLLSDRAEEEDIKEEMLLYSVLAKEPASLEEFDGLREAIEQFLQRKFGVNVQFDILDALERLQDDGLVFRAPDGALRALTPSQGCLHVDRKWDAHLDTAAFYNDPDSQTVAT